MLNEKFCRAHIGEPVLYKGKNIGAIGSFLDV